MASKTGRIAILLAGAMAAACGDSSGPDTNPVPTVTAITPISAQSGATITVTGTNFVRNSVIKLDTMTMTTTFVSKTELRVTLTNFARSGKFDVTVVSPAPGGGTSNAIELTVTHPACLLATNIAFGQTLTGTLVASDCPLEDGSLADVYRLTLTSTQQVRIQLTSTAFDPFLILTRQDGSTIAEDDDGAGEPNSRIDQTLTAGTYFIYANSFQPNGSGAYTVSVTPQVAPPGPDPCLLSNATAITVPQLINGTLASTDCRLSDNSFADLYRVVLTQTTTLTIDLTSSAFDTYLLIANAQGQVIHENDDVDQSNANSRLVQSLAAGTYYIAANSFDPNQFGAYVLNVR